MFNLGNLGNIANMLRSAQEMGAKVQGLQEELRAKRVTGTAGGGMVEVEMTGTGEMLSLRIDPDLVARGEREIIEDLVPAAVNQASMKAKQLHAEMMKELTGSMNVPGLDEALSKVTGGSK
ncbi:YbaB/EbfC family nucleoid-associated protein [Blastopirellula sp. JC732]|uniref:Nucleoid-associated protein LOC68_10200 n=1 Tax=Blastopirellula sediminis TaxID=2894196 RepID=A0A9X1SJA4_9BACT|nr:YbaB/EbfC family nucleoid-associated protein [Blastopirellula sediminis]MCC9608454.1 YbaB/EbfC family nucleoid-associated protein [Blastopirellula sediminis]MCC9628769.1 YbaB/EbfC family nucleoid-associated protein [Blastopirellula sediminis]